MSDPKKNEPHKKPVPPANENDKSATSAFRLRWRDSEHDLGGDDDTPAVAYPSKPNPPRLVVEPPKDEPAKYDFTPYRKGSSLPTGFNPDDVDDVDYDSPFGPSGDYAGDDDDDMDERDEDPMFRIAERLLPARPEIINTLDLISNVDFDSLVAAGIIEEEMRGQLPDKTVDRLTAAALLSGADNAYDILEELPKKTADLMVDFNMASAAGNAEAPEFSQLSPNIQRLIIAFSAGDFESLAKGLKNQTTFAPDDDSMMQAAEFIVDASRSRSEKPTKGDVRLLGRAAKAFNEVSELMPLDFELRQSNDNTFIIQNKSELDPQTDRNMKKSAGNNKRNQPKPPKNG